MEKITKFGLFLFGIIVFIHPGHTSLVAREATHKIHKRCVPNLEEAIAECCKHSMDSPEYMTCCNVYGCCPLCDGINEPQVLGCCYNDKYYEVGVVIVQFPEVCLELVCMIGKSDPRIIHRPMTPCDDPCDSGLSGDCFCKDLYIDSLLHPCGTSWIDMKDPCVKHQCSMDGVIYSMMIDCPVTPCDAEPVYIKGECCPVYDCDQCFCEDQYGTIHGCGDSWYDVEDPCIKHECGSDRLITSMQVVCPPAPCDVDPVSVEGECCPRYDCGGPTNCSCVYGEPPASYPCGTEIGPGEQPCTVFLCTEDGRILIEEADPPCPPLPTDIGCASYTTLTNMTTCCPYIECTGSIGGSGTAGGSGPAVGVEVGNADAMKEINNSGL